MAKPILSQITVFDATVGTTLSYVLYGATTTVTVTVYDNETGTQVYQGTAASVGTKATKTFEFPANVLTNKLDAYYMKIKATDGSKESELSDPVLFYCRQKPTLTFSNLSPNTPNTITTSSGQFELIYTNIAEQGESLNSYQYHLYDSTRNILLESPVYYGDISAGFSVDGFSNNQIYYIRGTGESINGYTFDTGYISLQISYEVELNRTLLDGENQYDDGTIKISSTIAFLEGVAVGDISYIQLGTSNYGADLTKDNGIAYTLPYTLESYRTRQYSIRVSVKPLIYKNLLVITHEEGSYTLSTNIRAFTDADDTNKKFYAVLKGTNRYVLESNYLTEPNEDDFINIYIMLKDGYFSMYIDNIGNIDVA